MNAPVHPEFAEWPVAYFEEEPRDQPPLTIEPFHVWRMPDGTDWALFFRGPSGYLVRFPRLADFEVSPDGKHVHAWPIPGTTGATLQQLHLNQVLPLALSKQGQIVLHASAVEISGQAVAFVGPSGRGKSTLAASFAMHGTGFLTDDGLHLVWRGEELMVLPSHPSIRLWEASRTALGTDTLQVAPPVAYTSKARYLAGAGLTFCAQARPLRRIYLLGTSATDVPHLARAKPADAMMAMVRNSFLLDIEEHQVLARHFTDFARIAEMPIHYHLDYARHYDELPRLREIITRHLLEPDAE
jgi:hypothetical protein